MWEYIVGKGKTLKLKSFIYFLPNAETFPFRRGFLNLPERTVVDSCKQNHDSYHFVLNLWTSTFEEKIRMFPFFFIDTQCLFSFL